MLKGIQFLTLLFLVALAGCSTEPQRPGLPTWDFERDELALGALDECDLRVMVASNDHSELEIIRTFEMEFGPKKMECAVLIVRESLDSNKWTVAGFNEAGEYRTIVIDESNHELLEELTKDSANQNISRIKELATSSLGRTIVRRRALPIGAVVGALAGGLFGAKLSNKDVGALAGAVVGAIVADLDLTPTELNDVILTALAQKTAVSAPTQPLSNRVADTQWTISESHEGQISTDWRPITGRKAGVLWWEKTYDCEVRHIITVNRSYISHRLTNFTINTEVRERPNENYPWAPADPELGRSSFESLKNLLLNAVREELFKRRAEK